MNNRKEGRNERTRERERERDKKEKEKKGGGPKKAKEKQRETQINKPKWPFLGGNRVFLLKTKKNINKKRE